MISGFVELFPHFFYLVTLMYKSYFLNYTRCVPTFVQLGPRSKQSLSVKDWTKGNTKITFIHPPTTIANICSLQPTTVKFLTSSRHSRRLYI